MNTDNGFSSFVETLSAHKDTVAEIVDNGLEIAEEIPFVGWAVKAWNIKNTFQEKKLSRNIQEFLVSSSVDDAQKFISRFSSEKEKEDLCDSLIQVLIDSEKPFKAVLTSKIINSIYHGNLSVSDANQLLLIILNASIPALQSLADFHAAFPDGRTDTMSSASREHGPLLMSMGVLYVHGNMTRITGLGKRLYENAFQ